MVMVKDVDSKNKIVIYRPDREARVQTERSASELNEIRDSTDNARSLVAHSIISSHVERAQRVGTFGSGSETGYINVPRVLAAYLVHIAAHTHTH